ncbi:MAG: tetratricopeptide repeat protein [Alphaproteobacteria bacterium]|nr:tetratricopeptide repeat protein [Alphaproteobacteria bacterium]
MSSPKVLLKQAQEALQKGGADKAEKFLKQALEADPAFGEARYELGGALIQLGRLDEAAVELEVVAVQAPDNLAVWLRLGDLRFSQTRLDKAIDCYRKVLALDPAIVSAHNNLGNALLTLGQEEAAAASYREAAKLAPERPEPWNNLGVALLGLEDFAGAAEAFGKAANLRPDFAAAWANLAAALGQMGRVQEAEATARRAVELAPQLPEAHNTLGNILAGCNKRLEARESYGRATALRPTYAEAHVNLGRLAMEEGDRQLAMRHYRHALSHRPDSAAAHDALGVALAAEGQTDEAIRHHEQAIARNPRLADAYVNLGNALTATARLYEARKAYRTAISLAPADVVAQQNHLMCLCYDETVDEESLYREHRRFGDYQEKRITPLPLPARPKALPSPLRLGFVSPDFRRHSVAYFLEPLLAGLDPARVRVFLYADVPNPDEVTERLKGHAHAWCDLQGLSDEQAARRVRQDNIDILIDLAGHTAGNRMGLFVLAPAPIQATWLGYPATTGLSRIGWRLTDAIADPEGKADELHTEKLVRLNGFLCYRPDEAAPEPAPPPALANGFITFGSFNALAKLSERDLGLMARLLKTVPQSRLLLKARPLADAGVKARLIERMTHHGIDPDRVELLGRTADSSGHLALYSRIDIALDPVHYNGTATTAEALWMGVPVVTLQGQRHAARVGASILTRAGLPHLIAKDEEAYVALAAQLASDLPALAIARQTQRQKISASPFLDAKAFAQDFTQAMEKIWEASAPSLPPQKTSRPSAPDAKA